MITQPTVLVLGAGASADYGYPTGQELKNQVIELLDSLPSDHIRTLIQLGHRTSEQKAFRDALAYSGRPSVDAFLEHRQEFTELGKLCTAMILIQRESIPTLFSSGSDWCQYLFQRMNSSFADFEHNKIAFVMFNYDRSLEQYLSLTLQNSYGKTEDEVSTVLANIKIQHVHGSIGKVPGQESTAREYRPTFSPEEIRDAAEGIRIISEPMQEKESFAPVADLMPTGSRTIFLGSGFLQANFQRLNLDLASGQNSFIASAHDFTELERKEIEQWFKPSQIVLARRGWKTLQCLREMISL